MAGPFRPAGGPNSASVVLAELARLWDQAEHRAAGRGERLTQKGLARVSRVPLTTVNSWATGTSLPRDLDRLTAVGAVLARWAGGDSPGERDWERLLRTDQAARGVLDEGGGNGAPVGWLVAELTDPFMLEVHRPVQPEDAPPGLPALPPYVPREHDEVLDQVVAAAAGGCSGIAVLVGGSSTGKTRACWEALNLLRGQDPPWRLWHPIDPTRPDAARAELPGIGPRTVVWLNEAQFYLDPAETGLGERVAAGLRELLRNPGRAPVLVLATVWQEFWDALTVRPPGEEDRHAQARELLAGHDIPVPAAFTPAQVSQLASAADARLALAARSARDREVIQFLAGAPELLARYRNAPPAVKALIKAAMDARRLSTSIALPQAFLEAAVPGYLTADQRDALGEDWLEQALADTARPAKGLRGPLTRIRPRPARHAARPRGDQPGDLPAAAGPLYRLADYLDQYGRAHRTSQIPPAEFWVAAAAHAAPTDQATLGDAAGARGMYRAAAQLHKNAAARGDPRAVSYLSNPPDYLRPDARPMHWAAAHVSLEDPDGVARLLDILQWAGAHDQAAALAARAAAHATLDDPYAVARLLDILRKMGAHDQAATLLARDPATHVLLDHPGGVADLLDILWKMGAHDRAATLLARDPAAHATLDDPYAVARLLSSLRQAGAHDQAATLLARDPATHVLLDSPYAVACLVGSLWRMGAHDQADALAARAATHVPLENPAAVARVLFELWEMRAQDQLGWLLARDPAAHATLDDPYAVARLLASLGYVGAYGQAAALLARDPAAHAGLKDPGAVANLLHELREVGAHAREQAAMRADPAAHAALKDPGAVASWLDILREVDAHAHDQAAALLARDPAAHATLKDPGAVASLLNRLREMGAHDQAAALLARDPAAHATLKDPGAVASLLNRLREMGAHDQATALLARDPATHATLADPRAVASLLNRLREMGAHDQATMLVSRLPSAGMFFLEQKSPADQFRFGREADGTPAAPWGWEDLDLWLVPVRGDKLHRRSAERDAHVGRHDCAREF